MWLLVYSRTDDPYPDVPPDYSQAARWCFEDASQSAGSVCYSRCTQLGHYYREGEGVETNAVEAVKWYRRAIDLGVVSNGGTAEYQLAFCYFGGEGVPQDDAEGLKWIKKAIENGYKENRELENAVARYASEDGDQRTALKYWRKLAAQGDARAAYWVGAVCYIGQGVPRDYQEAVRWLQIGAAKGDQDAQFNLGLAYDEGKGVTRDYGEAGSWYRRSAEQGNQGGQINLGVCYMVGKGVPRDYVAAHKWFNLAAAQSGEGGETANRNISILERRMNTSQIAEAQRLAREFVPRKEPTWDETQPIADKAKANGTGFFITEDGYLITNQHVGEGNLLDDPLGIERRSIKVRTAAGELPARVIRSDAANDLALLKVEGTFTALPIKPSRGVRLGETVATVGFPNPALQGFSPKLTKVEINSLAGLQDDPKHFQVSLPIQPGNSGGALVDSSGNVVGVVVAKLSQRAALATTGTLAENVNYAVKSSFLLSFLESVPGLAEKLKEPRTDKRPFEEVVRDTEKSTALVLVY